VFCSSLTLLMLLGLWKAWRKQPETTVPFLLILGIVPLTYYITHPCIDYRHIIDPEIVMLAVYGLVARSKLQRA
jgi:hypothetical protein